MKHFFSLLRHEIKVLLISPGTYIAAIIFLLITGIFFQSVLSEFTRAAQENSPAVDFFKFFWIPIWLMVPLLTMKSIAEERRQGTLETLMTTPVSVVEMVLAKFTASYLFYVLLWAFTLSFQAILFYFAPNPRLLDPAPLIGGYAYIAVSGLFFVSIGLFASALTRSQLIAGILGVLFIFITSFAVPYLLLQLIEMQNHNPEWLKNVVDYFNVFQQIGDVTSGVFDSRPLVLYLSGTAFLLFASVLAVEARTMKS